MSITVELDPEGPQPERTGVYRIRGDAAELLYIGMTNCLPARWNSHMLYQPWWHEVRALSIEYYDSREEAAAAEKAAILAERPKYNKAYLMPSRTGPRPKPRVVTVPEAPQPRPPAASASACGSRWEGPMLTTEGAAKFLGITEEELLELVRSDRDLIYYDFDPLAPGDLRFLPNELRAYAAYLPEGIAA